MRPTHVMVAVPVDCQKCGGTGEVEYGFAVTIRPDGTRYCVCPNCRGAKFSQYAMTLEDFAKLFTYGGTMHFENGECTGMTHDIRVREDARRATGPEGK